MNQLLQRLAENGHVSGPYKARQLPSLATVFESTGPLPLWLRFQPRKIFDLIDTPPDKARRSRLFGLFAGWE